MIHQSLTEIGKYRIERELGRGGMGVVYRAFDTIVERPVAIKTIGQGDAPAKLLTRLKREAKAAGQLEHPNIVSLYDAGETDGLFYMVMQLVHGETIQQRITRRWEFSLQEILVIFRQLLQALAYAHARGLVHRDIKPANIMITPEGVVKVADFGIAKFTDTCNSSAGMVVGTPSYMSPEQILGRTVDARSDIFALGCVLYELVTGKKAFAGNDTTSIIYKIVHESPPRTTIVVPDMPDCIEPLILKALAKNPDERFNSCAAFERALEACVASASKSAVPVPDPWVLRPSSQGTRTAPPTWRTIRTWNRPVVWIGALLGILSAVLLIPFLAKPTTVTRGDVQFQPQPQPSLPRPSQPLPAAAASLQVVPTAPGSLSADRAPPSVPPARRPHESAGPPPPSVSIPSPQRPGGELLKVQERATPAPTETFRSLMLRGDVSFSQNHYSEALAHYRDAERLEPDNPGLRRMLRVVNTMLERPAVP
jgi:serine/threonine protein kinase